MPLTVYKRGKYYWVRGVVRGHSVRRSLQTTNREVAHKRASELELGLDGGLVPMRWEELAPRFLAGYAGTTQERFQRFLLHLTKFFDERKRPWIHDARSLDIEEFLRRRPAGNNTVRHEIGKLRTIFTWCVRHDIVRDNPALKLALPREVPAETQPFMPDELVALDAAIDRSFTSTRWQSAAPELRARLRAMHEIMRTTGIRVSDLVQLRPEHIANGYLTLRTQKTKAVVRIPLLEPARTALAAVDVRAGGYYFWEEGIPLKGACHAVWKAFVALGKRAGVAGVHPHRYRDTFAVNLLLAGADLRLVSKLMGHTSIRTTEKHYAPWVQAFQDQADQAMRQAEAQFRASAQAAGSTDNAQYASGTRPKTGL